MMKYFPAFFTLPTDLVMKQLKLPTPPPEGSSSADDLLREAKVKLASLREMALSARKAQAQDDWVGGGRV